jgi:ankyrin repeat protein
MNRDSNQDTLGAQLLEAIRLQDVERVRALLALGADPNTREPERRYVYHHGYLPTDHETALTLACNALTEERIAIVRMLLDCGADPAVRNGNGLDASQIAERTRAAAADRKRMRWLREQVDVATELANAVRARVFRRNAGTS